MPIPVNCSCGKRAVVADVLAGRSIKCSKCGEEVDVPRGAAAAAGKAAPAPKDRSSPAIYISSGKIVAICILAAIAIGIILFVTGPVRTYHKWLNEVQPRAIYSVKDVIPFALEAKLAATGYFDPGASHAQPTIDSEIYFNMPLFVMSMPTKIPFHGTSTVGPYSGTFDTVSGEIDADVSYVVITGIAQHRVITTTHTFHILGRDDENGKASAEENGQKLEIFYPNMNAGEK